MLDLSSSSDDSSTQSTPIQSFRAWISPIICRMVFSNLELYVEAFSLVTVNHCSKYTMRTWRSHVCEVSKRRYLTAHAVTKTGDATWRPNKHRNDKTKQLLTPSGICSSRYFRTYWTDLKFDVFNGPGGFGQERKFIHFVRGLR